MSESAKHGRLALLLSTVVLSVMAAPALGTLVTYTPMQVAGYASAGFTVVPVTPISNDFYAQDPNSGHYIDGTLTSGVLMNPSTGDYLFYYTIAIDAGSDPIDAFQLTNFNPPMYTQGIGAMGYNTAVTGSDPLLIPTDAMVWIPPGTPWAKYLFDYGDGIPGGYATEVYYIAGPTTDVVTGTAILVNSVSAVVEAQVNVYGPPDNVIPEPATLLLVGAGLLGFGVLRRRH